MNYEKKYNEALNDMRAIYSNLKGDAKLAVEHAFPELRESEDERVLHFLKDQAIEWIASLEHDISQSVYDGIKGHDPEAEKELERWQTALAWLEKQKEQNKAEWSKEDAARLKEEIDAFNESVKDWLNFRCPRPKQKRGDDEGLIDLAVAAIEDFYGKSNPIRSQIINLLKSLRPSWKPTYEQLEALRKAAKKLANTEVADSVRLSILYDHLKELM